MNPDWTIPLLYADYNQTGGRNSLYMCAQVRIINPTNGATVAFWDLDSITNTAWDQNAPIYNFGDITFGGTCLVPWNPLTGVGCAGATISGLEYSSSHNLGSGKADFMAYAPETVNLGCNPNGLNQGLGQALDSGLGQGCNTNGFEEFGIIGGIGGNRIIPEPGSLLLLTLGLAGAGFTMRRKSRK